MKKLLTVILSVFFFSGIAGFGNKIQAAEQYPVKPINFILGLGPGSNFEIAMHPLLEKASEILGKPIVIIHKPGAGSIIGYRETYRAKPDGYTIGGMLGNIIAVKSQGLLPFDYRDFTIINTAITMYPLIFASTRTKRPFKTIQDVLEFAKSNPGEVTIATVGAGQANWIAAMYFQEKAGRKFNIIPQEGGTRMAVAQVAGGHLELGICGLSAVKPQVEAGNVLLLASMSPNRLKGKYSYVPTLIEAGYDITYNAGVAGIIGPPKMPKDIVDKLARTFETAFNDPKFQRHLIACNEIPLFLRSNEAFERLKMEQENMENILRTFKK